MRPVRNPKKALTVTMKVFIQQVLTVDAKHQMIEVNAWLKYVISLFCVISETTSFKVWTDFRLRWNPLDYDNITSVRFFGEDQIWQPDILLYNRYIEEFDSRLVSQKSVCFSEQESFDITYKTNAIAYSDGVINWIPPGIFKVDDVQKFSYYDYCSDELQNGHNSVSI